MNPVRYAAGRRRPGRDNGVIVFLLPIFLVMLGLALAAYYLIA
jgi:hypothetical protein